MIITNNDINVSSKDVYICTDVNILKKWIIEIESSIQSCKMQLNDAKSKAYLNNEYSDIEWFRRTENYIKIQNLLIKQIQHRLSEVKFNDELVRQKELKNQFQKERDFWKEKVKEKNTRYFNKCLKEFELKFDY